MQADVARPTAGPEEIGEHGQLDSGRAAPDGLYSGPGYVNHHIRTHRGELVAVHRRRLDADGRKIGLTWWHAAGDSEALRPGLPPGVSLRDLPLYGSDFSGSWPRDAVVLITEGEKACEALWRIAILAALGTATGAAIAPAADAISPVARGRRFVVWPDHDSAGERHAANVAAALLEAGARSVSRVAYRYEDDFPGGWDAADAVVEQALRHDVNTASGRAAARAAVNAWWKARLVPVAISSAGSKARAPGQSAVEQAGVSDLLRAMFGVRAGPGTTVRCPMHDDRRASLWVTGKDTRAICMTPECAWSLPGVGIAELTVMSDVG